MVVCGGKQAEATLYWKYIWKVSLWGIPQIPQTIDLVLVNVHFLQTYIELIQFSESERVQGLSLSNIKSYHSYSTQAEGDMSDMSGMCSHPSWAEVPHASIHPELSLLAVLRVDAGRSGVVYTSPETELHLAPEEGTGRDGAQIICAETHVRKLMGIVYHSFSNVQSDMSTYCRCARTPMKQAMN